ncbi:MAG: NTP transferase domain-containing protein, partial [Rhodanobacteraceae bacterium]
MLALHGEPVVARVVAALRPQCDEVLIVANRNEADYSRHARVIGDEIRGNPGPLAGVAAALALVAETEAAAFHDCRWLLTTPVDCPDLPDNLFARLHAALDAAPKASCAYARDEHRLQPLFALYSLRNRGILLESVRRAAGLHASALRWHLELHALEVDFRDRTDAFRNLNAPGDFQEYERTHGKS